MTTATTRSTILPAMAGLAAVMAVVTPAQERERTAISGAGWLNVDYREVIDTRRPTHSGEQVGVILRRLGGRPLPRGSERPEDRLDHVLLDPMLEPYAFVVIDALDAVVGSPSPPMFELAGLWVEGEPQPAWVELLRARRLVLESDGAGRMRACLPLTEDMIPESRRFMKSSEAARRVWERWWPVLRHVLAVERRRLGAASDALPALEVRVHPFVHRPARSAFLVGVDPYTVRVEDTEPRGGRPPLDIASLQAFLKSGLRLEGARLEPDGKIRLFGSDPETRAALLGSDVTLADLAVAYRAVFRGGLAEPYMSLDRGHSPFTAIVNYGGRLRDTRAGEVALRCDVRFKTFSVGLDAVAREDVRDPIRKSLPDFRTHLERFAADPSAAGVLGQQTRLWFYPDDVELTLSAGAEVLALSRIRMSAASERLQAGSVGAAAGEDPPPWTRATIGAINRDYDTLATLFPELDDLDQLVRLLSLFAWLRVAQGEGLTVPDLDTLMAVELPERYTPRRFPRLLAFNALPPPGGQGSVEVFDRLDVAERLQGTRSASGHPLPARRRFERAVANLDPKLEDDRRLLGEIAAHDVGALDDARLDFLSYRAERLVMHRLVLSTLAVGDRERLIERDRAGEALRVFSVGIGGLDLGMEKAIRSATRRSVGILRGGPVARRSAPPRSIRSPVSVLDHGSETVPENDPPIGSIRIDMGKLPSQQGGVRMRVVSDRDGPGIRVRTVETTASGVVSRFWRFEDGRGVAYFLERFGREIRARVHTPARLPVTDPPEDPAPVPEGLLTIRLDGSPRASEDPDTPAERDTVSVRLGLPGGRNLTAEFPRVVLKRLVLGRGLDTSSDPKLPGLAPPAPEFGVAERILFELNPDQTRPPDEAAPRVLASEEDAAVVARALRDWYRTTGVAAHDIAVGVDARAAWRWQEAPAVDRKAFLLLSPSGSETESRLGRDLDAIWPKGRISDRLPSKKLPSLVVLVGDEPPGVLARRLRSLATDPAMEGRLLAVYAPAGGVRQDLPAVLLGEGLLAGFGLAEFSPVDRGRVVGELTAIATTLSGGGRDIRVGGLPGSLLWYYGGSGPIPDRGEEP